MATYDGNDVLVQKVLRITDIAEEPLEFLTAISGYEKMPVVSIEDAVEPLVSTLPLIKSYTYRAKMLCQDPCNGLTQDESASIMLYTMGWESSDECLYIVLNATLRMKNREKAQAMVSLH